jgi:hypothetical protein
MPVVGNKEHGTGEAAKGISGEEGCSHADGAMPDKMQGDYGAGDSGVGPQIITEGDSSRTSPLKGTKE